MSTECDAVRERMAAVNAMDPDPDPDLVFITFYVRNQLPPEMRQEFELRLREDAAFRNRAEPMIRLWAHAYRRSHRAADREPLPFPRRSTGVGNRPPRSFDTRKRTRVPWLVAASIIVVLAPAGVAARVALMRHAGDTPHAVTSNIPRGDGGPVASRPATATKSAAVASPATGATPTRNSGPKTSARPHIPAAIPPVRDELHDSPKLLASVKPATPLMSHPAGRVACSAPSRMAARAHELAQAAADSAARDSALQGTRPSPWRELLNGAAAQGARGSAAVGMHPAPSLGARPARPVIPPAGGGAVPPKAADSTTKAPAVSGNACDGGAPGNPKTGEPRRNP